MTQGEKSGSIIATEAANTVLNQKEFDGGAAPVYFGQVSTFEGNNQGKPSSLSKCGFCT